MRPQFHFTADRGWINDPHGITARDGGYDVFFQYVPNSMVWGPNCHWGHASGPDLLSLQHLPVALAPGDGDDGIWTGSLVQTPHDGARILYTSTVAPDLGQGRIREARPDDQEWRSWTKLPSVLASPPKELDLVAYRDPFVFRDGDFWRMFVGAGTRDGTAAAIGYTSTDLEQWTYQGVAVQRSTHETDPVWMGALWECPQLFEIDGRHVLVTSVWDDDVLHYAGYGIGTFTDGRFVPETWGRLTFGRSYYAPSFFRDAAGRPCLTFWLRGVRDDEEGWSSAHSVPHVLSLAGDRLIAAPHPDLDRYTHTPLAEGDEIPGHAVDVRWQPDSGDRLTARFGEMTALRIEATDTLLVVFGAGEPAAMPYRGGSVRILIDGPTAEISTEDGILATPVSATAARLTVTADGATPELRPLLR